VEEATGYKLQPLQKLSIGERRLTLLAAASVTALSVIMDTSPMRHFAH